MNDKKTCLPYPPIHQWTFHEPKHDKVTPPWTALHVQWSGIESGAQNREQALQKSILSRCLFKQRNGHPVLGTHRGTTAAASAETSTAASGQ